MKSIAIVTLMLVEIRSLKSGAVLLATAANNNKNAVKSLAIVPANTLQLGKSVDVIPATPANKTSVTK